MTENERLADWMKEAGLTDGKLAKKLKLSLAHVWRVRNGQRRVTNEFRWRYAEAYGWEEAGAMEKSFRRRIRSGWVG